MPIRFRHLLAAVALTCLSATVHAHHSHASLNNDDVRLFQGTVSKYSWRAPHVYIIARVVGEDGSVREYKVEALNPPAMAALGWDKDTFKPGDLITWEGAHDQDVDRAYAGINWADTPDGTRLLATATAQRQALADQAKANAGLAVPPVTKIGTGSWNRIAASGRRHPPIRRPSDDWPLTPEYVEKVANFSEDDNPINNCVYGGPPRNIVSLSNFKWSRPDENTIIIDRDMWLQPRVIHLNADAPRGEASSFGHSVGHFEGDELIIETDNFLAETWGMYTGIDSSDQKSLVERYWLSEGGMRLNVEFTVTDPVVLTEPYTYTHQWKRVPDRELAKAPCSLENAWAYKLADYGDEADIPDDIRAAIEAEAAAERGADDVSTTATEQDATSALPIIPLGLVLVLIIVFAAWRRKKS